MDLWFLIDPSTGSAAKGAQIACTALDDLFDGLSKATQDDIDNVFNEILSSHDSQLSELTKSVNLLIPKASVTYKQGEWGINGHGITSVTDYSNRKFTMNFTEHFGLPLTP